MERLCQSTVTLGSWTAKFDTEPIWEGIPERLDYTSTEHWHVDETEQRSFRDTSKEHMTEMRSCGVCSVKAPNSAATKPEQMRGAMKLGALPWAERLRNSALQR